MGRKSATVTVPKFDGTDNRDLGKSFFLTEWPAAIAEKWALKMMFAFNRSGGSIPLDMAGIGMEGIAILGINTFLRGNIQSEEIIPLWDELLGCVAVVRDTKRPDVRTPLLDDDIEEVATRMWLRAEVLTLHINFSISGALYALWQSITKKLPD